MMEFYATEIRKVHIKEADFDNRIVSRLKELLKITGDYIEDGWVIELENCYTSHSFTLRDKLRKATELDMAFFMLAEVIRKKIQDNMKNDK